MKQDILVHAPGTMGFLSSETRRISLQIRCKTVLSSDKPLLNDYLRLHRITLAIHEFIVSVYGRYIGQSVITDSGSFTFTLQDCDPDGLKDLFQYISDSLSLVFNLGYHFSYSVDSNGVEIDFSPENQWKSSPHRLFAVRPGSGGSGFLEGAMWNIKTKSPRPLCLPDGLLAAGLPGVAADFGIINKYSGRLSLLFSDSQSLIIAGKIDDLFRLASALRGQYNASGLPMSAGILHPGIMDCTVPEANENCFSYGGEVFSWKEAETILYISSRLEQYRNSATPREYRSLSAGLYKASHELSEKYKSGSSPSRKDSWSFRYCLRDISEDIKKEFIPLYDSILFSHSQNRIPSVNPLVFGVASQLAGFSDNY